MRATIFNPLFWVLLFLVLSIVVRKSRLKSRLRAVSIVLFLVFTNNYISTFFTHLWEFKTIEVKEIIEPYDIGLVLGPFIDQRRDRPNGLEIIHLETIRFTQAVQLYKQGKFKKFLLSGNDNIELARSHLISLCIPPNDILTESMSSNTYENARFSKLYVSQNNLSSKKILLITSAIHMRRAYKCFQKIGMEVTPFSVEFWSSCADLHNIGFSDIIPNSNALGKWRSLIREWTSTIIFRIKGYI